MKRTGLIASVSATNLVKVPLRRVVLIGENIELRIVSLVVRCREVAEEVVLFDTGSTDETVQLAEEVQSQVVHFDGEHTPQALARATKAASLDDGLTLFLSVESTWKLASLPLSVNRAREGWDIHYLYRSERSANEEAPQPIAQSFMGHLITSSLGLDHLAALPDDATMDDVSDEVRARFIKTDSPIQLPQRQSLATASRFAQLFYWMLESKHPLLLFGIPGVVLFVLGYRLSGDLATMFTELNSTSIGVTLITIAMTLVGLFAMMVAIILYIMGKQVARIQNQYNWPKGS